MRAADIMWKTYDTVQTLIRFSDTKAAAILAINGAIMTIIFSKIIDNIKFIKNNDILLLIFIFGFASGIISILLCLISLYPALKMGETSSMISFGNIAKNYNNKNTYKINVMNALKDDIDEMDQITEQVWITSKIALDKYVRIVWAIRFLFLFILLICMAGYYILYLYK